MVIGDVPEGVAAVLELLLEQRPCTTLYSASRLTPPTSDRS